MTHTTCQTPTHISAPHPANAWCVEPTRPDLAAFRTSYPLTAPESANWTERVVTEGHAAACAEFGHATWTIDGIVQDRCPRCGEIVAR